MRYFAQIMRTKFCLLSVCLLARIAQAASFEITSLDGAGNLTWANAFTGGVVTVETRGGLAGSWALPQEMKVMVAGTTSYHHRMETVC